jgi:hypothetical protein
MITATASLVGDVTLWPVSMRSRSVCTNLMRYNLVVCYLPCAGDVVISTRPVQADENIIKRVTAVEGQTVNLYKPGSIAPVQIQVRGVTAGFTLQQGACGLHGGRMVYRS